MLFLGYTALLLITPPWPPRMTAHLLLPCRLTPPEHPPPRDGRPMLVGQRRRRSQPTDGDRVWLKRCRGDHDARLAVTQRDRDGVRMRRVGLLVRFAAPDDSCWCDKGPFKCYIVLFSGNFTPTNPPRNANNVEPYIFVTFFFREIWHPPTYCITWQLNGLLNVVTMAIVVILPILLVNIDKIFCVL